jgi:hypothetical protein
MPSAERVSVRNINKSELYNGSLSADFRSKVGDLKEMSLGYIQAVYSGHDATDGAFELFVAATFCGTDDHFARYPNSALTMDAGCASIGWNLLCAGYRFFQIRYTKNSVTAGTVEIFAIAKKG